DRCAPHLRAVLNISASAPLRGRYDAFRRSDAVSMRSISAELLKCETDTLTHPSEPAAGFVGSGQHLTDREIPLLVTEQTAWQLGTDDGTNVPDQIVSAYSTPRVDSSAPDLRTDGAWGDIPVRSGGPLRMVGRPGGSERRMGRLPTLPRLYR